MSISPNNILSPSFLFQSSSTYTILYVQSIKCICNSQNISHFLSILSVYRYVHVGCTNHALIKQLVRNDDENRTAELSRLLDQKAFLEEHNKKLEYVM